MSADASLIVRPPRAADYADWLVLWQAYNGFYRAAVPPEATAATWTSITSNQGDLAGFVAERGARLVGLAHFLFHPSSWSTQPSCYLEDLFVAPTARGTGAGAALIEAVADAARACGSARLYWHTQEFNAPARSLYDSVAERTSFIVYRKGL